MSEQLHLLLADWSAALGEVFGAMADQKPAITWEAAPAPEGDADLLWWKQPLPFAENMTIWVAAPRPAWEYAGAITLKAAGLETVEPAEARNTYIEILSQSLSALARSIGAMLGREVTCGPGEEQPPRVVPEAGAAASVSFADSTLPPLWIGFSPMLMALIEAPPGTAKSEPSAPADESEVEPERQRPTFPPTMDLLLEVELPVSISFGKAEIPMKDVLKLTTGSIVELNRLVNEPVDVMVNRCLIARGEVVVVEGNYGVRIQQIASREDRLRSLR